MHTAAQAVCIMLYSKLNSKAQNILFMELLFMNGFVTHTQAYVLLTFFIFIIYVICM